VTRLVDEIPIGKPGLTMSVHEVTQIQPGTMPDGSTAIYIDYKGVEVRAPYAASIEFEILPGDYVLVLTDLPRRFILCGVKGANYNPFSTQVRTSFFIEEE